MLNNLKKSSKKSVFTCLILGVAIMLAPSVGLGQNVFVRIEGIPGEAQDASHSEWIEALGYLEGITSGSSGAGTMAVARTARGGSRFENIEIIKPIDKATPRLRQAALERTPLKEVIIELTRESDGKTFLEITLENAFVRGISADMFPSEEDPKEIVSLEFRRIKYSYTEYDSTGRMKGKVEFGWDVAAGKRY